MSFSRVTLGFTATAAVALVLACNGSVLLPPTGLGGGVHANPDAGGSSRAKSAEASVDGSREDAERDAGGLRDATGTPAPIDASSTDAQADAGNVVCGSDAGPTVAASAILLAAGQANPAGLAVDGANVYWINLGPEQLAGGLLKPYPVYSSGSVMTCAIGGCNSAPTALATAVDNGVASTPTTPNAIAVGGGNVFWDEYLTTADAGVVAAVVACATTGCAGTPTTFGPGFANALATDDQSVYWTETDRSSGIEQILGCALAGCGDLPSTVGTIWSGILSPRLAMDNTNVYFFTGSGLCTCPKTGCHNEPTVLLPFAAVPAASTNLAVDANNVYWVTTQPDGVGAVFACPKTGCSNGPKTLASGLNTPSAVATDGENVYWTEGPNVAACGWGPGNTARIARCSVSGCDNQPTTLAAQLAQPAGLALDSQNVYWTDMGTGQVWQMPK
jgi:hypothetical protein